MPTVDDLAIAHYDGTAAATQMDDLCAVYADAYGAVPGEDIAAKTSAFRGRAMRALEARRYDLVTGRLDGELVGFVFGYSLRPNRGWWDGMTPEPAEDFVRESGDRTVVLAEIEVRRAHQGKGVGRRLHDAFLAGRIEERAALSTGPRADAAGKLYESWGWQRVGVVLGTPGEYFSEYVNYVLPLPLDA